VRTEIKRIEALKTKSATDDAMLKTLKDIETAITCLSDELKSAGTNADKIKKLKPYADTLKSTVSTAYHALPEEADAWAVAGRANTRYNSK
jgi:hypothetical protein